MNDNRLTDNRCCSGIARRLGVSRKTVCAYVAGKIRRGWVVTEGPRGVRLLSAQQERAVMAHFEQAEKEKERRRRERIADYRLARARNITPGG